MEIKRKAKNLRDKLQQGIYMVINPVVHGMIKIGITPNIVTTIGFLGNLVGACLLIYAGICKESNLYSLIGWAGGIILLSSLFDMMDGQVARIVVEHGIVPLRHRADKVISPMTQSFRNARMRFQKA